MRLIAGLAALVLSASAAFSAESLPVEGLTPYGVYRSVLIEYGWLPVVDRNAIPGFPEVVCGNALCIATWRGHGREVELTLWYGREPRSLVVAPQVDE